MPVMQVKLSFFFENCSFTCIIDIRHGHYAGKSDVSATEIAFLLGKTMKNHENGAILGSERASPNMSYTFVLRCSPRLMPPTSLGPQKRRQLTLPGPLRASLRLYLTPR